MAWSFLHTYIVEYQSELRDSDSVSHLVQHAEKSIYNNIFPVMKGYISIWKVPFWAFKEMQWVGEKLVGWIIFPGDGENTEPTVEIRRNKNKENI